MGDRLICTLRLESSLLRREQEVRQFGVGLYAETLESMIRKRSGLWPQSVDEEEK